ncbi:ketopantoate reductase C-terminal domain-containing protein [Yanshouia hominis]|uniref:Ketopantoate reductase C-terminal domain-containing protein n=1 Tax=Yanshouia hominis TaxID=2763673 RepID=A0ABR7NN94_9FIRM|nr:ketopantoate reductase C-terminal domain-containing protein [Yanshouia hominis]MBC8577894.1 hypothetical protein [Yanshouia hominis]
MIDVSLNQVSVVCQLTYGKLLKNKQAMETICAVQAEVVAVANSYAMRLDLNPII